uniref:Tetratricopeptide repeat domain 37 n=1 Tax=Eptatretus burgeri TaxID=7764 RepID=A0A8C4QPZ4_EPTBU
MGSKEIKVSLKAARESIKNKDFKEALKHCKAVLQLDKTNYTAWVFVGLAAAETEQPQKAHEAYKKASEIEPGQLLAWQGLANLYEKVDQPSFHEALPEIYERLLSLLSQSGDHNKWAEVCRKLAEHHQKQNKHDEAAKIWQRLVTWKREEAGMSPEELTELMQKLVACLLAEKGTPSSENQAVLEEVFEELIELGSKVGAEEHEKTLTEYIHFLSKVISHEEKLRKVCSTMSSTFPQNPTPLEALSALHIMAGDGGKEAVNCFTQLDALVPGHSLAVLGSGMAKLRAGAAAEAKSLLSKGVDQLSGTPALAGRVLLAEALLRSYDFEGCLVCTAKGLLQLNKDMTSGCDNETFRNKLLRHRARALMRHPNESYHAEAISVYTELLNIFPDDLELSVDMGFAYLANGEVEKARELLLSLREHSIEAPSIDALDGWISFTEGNLVQAEQRLIRATTCAPENGHFLDLMGRVYWAMGDAGRSDKNKAFTHFLKAARLEPCNGGAFKHLGLYYRDVAKEMVRARGCFRKAFELCPWDETAGADAVDACVALGDDDSALQILTSVTNQVAAGTAKWAWLRLGLYHLRQSSHTKAVMCLQAALRADPQDAIAWECLGEAYLSRGSYTAASKAFTRAAQLQPSGSLYGRLQAAYIRQALGQLREAEEAYLGLTKEHPLYVPAFKGLAECNLSLLRASLKAFLDLRAMDHAEKALLALGSAISIRPDLCCLWKLAGDVCSTIHVVHGRNVTMAVPTILLTQSDGKDSDTRILDKQEMLALGARCYGKALRILPDSSSLWHDLGLIYYRQAEYHRRSQQGGTNLGSSSSNNISELLDRALQSLKKAVMISNNNHQHWNALGIVAACPDVGNYALAQHAFIKSIQAEQNNVVAWTNLGALYLNKRNIELAHETFKVAQSVEPSYVACWIGQALIAENVGSEEAMDLFRHSTELALHIEGAKGYAHWVCTMLQDKSNRSSELYRFNIVRMNAVVAAHLAISGCTVRLPDEPVSLTMLGYLSEHMSLNHQAAKAYGRVVEIFEQAGTDQKKLNASLQHYGRTLRAVGRYEESEKAFRLISPLEHFDEITGLALTLTFLDHLQESYEAFERALTLATTERDRALVLIALALVEYRRGNHDDAKTLLFKCSLLTEPCADALYALCALGLTTADSTLASAALSELLKLQSRSQSMRASSRPKGGHVDSKDCAPEAIALLVVALAALGDQGKVPLRQVVKSIHRDPGLASLWELLARVIPIFSPSKAQGGIVAAKVAMALDAGRAKAAPMLAAVNSLAKGTRNAGWLRLSQQAAHLYPDDPSSWACLLASCHGAGIWAQVESGTGSRAVQDCSASLYEVLKTAVTQQDGKTQWLRALPKWGLGQAVASMLQSCDTNRAAKLCKEEMAVSQEAETSFLGAMTEHLVAKQDATASHGSLTGMKKALGQEPGFVYAWQALAEIYRCEGKVLATEFCYRQALQKASQNRDRHSKIGILLRLAHLAVSLLQADNSDKRWPPLAQEALTEALRVVPQCPLALLLRSLLLFSTNRGARQTRIALERVVYRTSKGTMASVARGYLLRHLVLKDDEQLLKVLWQNICDSEDERMEDLYRRLVTEI